MLIHTFLHLPGIGPATEWALWERGIATWEHLAKTLPRLGFPVSLSAELYASRDRLARGDADWFHARLPPSERWRLFADFRERALFLDIETTGLSPASGGYLTVVGTYDGREYRAFIRGKNLHQLPRELERYRLLVTYNGARFDVPFLEAELGPVVRHMAHIDLMYPLRRLGLRGGLKKVEQEAGLARPSALEGLDGYDAVRMWEEYQRGHREALDTLVRYNAEDVVVLEGLAVRVYNSLAGALPLGVKPLAEPPRPHLDLPFSIEVVERLKAQKGVSLDHP
ncbi:MAG: ribonuclease H-like domain-containing protein [Dehalococcoidia bacterium]|nr:ribonuclease H-like domain-containing protein [Dehalococcoidia bacterium]